MGALLKFLLITICILYLLRVLARIFLPFLFKKAVEKMGKQYGGGGFQYREYNYKGGTSNSKPEGKITVDYVPPADKKAPNLDKGGEFIDFEEVK
ncbi:DUF4834 family protein [Pseudopedobacter beijingensis]|uniref:DUF4834 family protein n=1 Tax=Pseudopedobacter beijingensis TaxID=1207056 RepID=A0ABW4I9I1_9SPHI